MEVDALQPVPYFLTHLSSAVAALSGVTVLVRALLFLLFLNVGHSPE